MKLISIGAKCNVKRQMNNHTVPSETLFFDWLSTDMDSVNQVIQCKNIDDILNCKNIIKSPTSKPNIRLEILISSLPYCLSIHDFSKDFSKKAIQDFINKYKRRYQRIIEFIKSTQKLSFIRYGKIEDNQKKTFIESVLQINPNCNFTLVSININQNTYVINKSNYFLEINLTDSPTKSQTEKDWTTSYLDWKAIFKTISTEA
jgi:hypothetical protein